MSTGLWTVLIYMAGDNNLEENAHADLRKLKAAMLEEGGSDGVRVLVQFDPFEEGVPTKRLEINSQPTLDVLSTDVVEDLGVETNTGDPAVLADFLRWGIRRAPARHYMVVVWNHGTGVDDSDIFRVQGRSVLPRLRRPPVLSVGIDALLNSHTMLIGSDEEAQDFLDTVELKKAFADLLADTSLDLGGGIAVIGFDACYMAMAEIYHQLSDVAAFGVGSEEIAPVEGWPYTEIVGNLRRNPEAGPAEVSAMLVEEYMRFYEGTEEPVTISAVNISHSGRLKEAAGRLAAALIGALDTPGTLEALMLSHYRAQSYNELRYVDLLDFCSLLRQHCRDERVVSACGEVEEVLTRSGYVHASDRRGESVAHSHGVAIYFPKRLLSPTYRLLDFSVGGQDAHWIDLLSKYTRLIERGDDGRGRPPAGGGR